MSLMNAEHNEQHEQHSSLYVPKYLRRRQRLDLMVGSNKEEQDENDASRANDNNTNSNLCKVDPLEIDIYLINGHRLGISESTSSQSTNETTTSTKDSSTRTKYGFHFGDTTYRQDGFSIGQDYLRMEGRTMTRGQLLTANLSIQELLGQGAFSQVHKALWTKRTFRIANTISNSQINQTFSFRDSTILGNCDPKEEEKKEEEIVSRTNTSAIEQTEVAVKQCSILESSKQRKEMLLKELRALCQLQSESLIEFYGAFLQEDMVVLVMEYMNLGSLQQWLKQSNTSFFSSSPCNKKEKFIAPVIFQVLSGLKYLHARRVLHRDIKPANILLHSDGSVKLCDFGIASLRGDQSLQTTVVGTSRFMSPERLRAKPYGRPSDIWSLGLVILECWTGEMPWKDCDSIVSLVISVEETATNDLIPTSMTNSNLEDVVLGCLQQSPEKRMPAVVLQQAPWFTMDHEINSVDQARHLLQG